MDTSIISISRISKTYKNCRAVDEVSFSVPPGSCFGFLGPNGAGKTTLMKMVYGRCLRDEHPHTKADIMGYDPWSQELNIKYLAGVVPQEDNLDIQLNTFQNLFVYSKFYGMASREAADRITGLLDFFEISDKRESNIKELSGGMKRRLIIARALLHNPRLLLLDEPTTGLDPQVRHLIWEKLRHLKTQGITILITTHYMEEAYQLCDTILIMDKGKKIMEGPPRLLLETHLEKNVLELHREQNLQSSGSQLDTSKVRIDDSRRPLMLFSKDMGALKAITRNLPPGEYLLRQSNLEDLFLKITGRGLHEGQ